MSSTLENALSLAKRGFFIFPLQPNGKKPLVKWREQSTTDEETIKSWFANAAPNIGIDCGKSGLCVIDVDDKTDPETGIVKTGKKSLTDLEAENFIFPDTYMVETPTGGLHLYYLSEGLSNSASTFAKDIDVRAEGGYVLSAGSEIDGLSYTVVPPETRIMPLPAWAAERCTKAAPKKEKKIETVIAADASSDEDWAVRFLKTYEIAVEGNAGDFHTYKMFCKLKDHGLSMHNAIQLADEHWSPRCSPPWDIEDLTTKAENAYSYAQNATGIKSLEHEFNEPQIINVKPPSQGYLVQTNCDDPLTIPKRDWVFGHIALRKQITVLVAPGGTGKSTFTIGVALAKASGKDFMGMPCRGIGRVAIYNNEDNLDEIKRREAAMRISSETSKSDISDEHGTRIFYGTGDQHMLRVMKKVKDGHLIEEQDVKILSDQVIAEKIDLLIVDPLAETHNADENDNGQMLRVAEVYRRIAQEANCALILVHHTRKRDKSASDGHSGNMDSLRGASSIASMARIVVTLDTMSKDTANKYLGKSKVDERFKYIELMFAKANMSATNNDRLIYEKLGVRIGVTDADPDGEEIGALKYANLTIPEINLKKDDKDLLNHVKELCTDTPQSLRAVIAELVKTNPFYADKKASSYVKSVSTIFNGREELPLANGLLLLTRTSDDKRGSYLISYEEDEIDDLEDLL